MRVDGVSVSVLLVTYRLLDPIIRLRALVLYSSTMDVQLSRSGIEIETGEHAI